MDTLQAKADEIEAVAHARAKVDEVFTLTNAEVSCVKGHMALLAYYQHRYSHEYTVTPKLVDQIGYSILKENAWDRAMVPRIYTKPRPSMPRVPCGVLTRDCLPGKGKNQGRPIKEDRKKGATVYHQVQYSSSGFSTGWFISYGGLRVPGNAVEFNKPIEDTLALQAREFAGSDSKMIAWVKTEQVVLALGHAQLTLWEVTGKSVRTRASSAIILYENPPTGITLTDTVCLAANTLLPLWIGDKRPVTQRATSYLKPSLVAQCVTNEHNKSALDFANRQPTLVDRVALLFDSNEEALLAMLKTLEMITNGGCKRKRLDI